MSTHRIYNFNPGPAILPLEVLNEVKDKFMSFGGMSILEISHRSKEFEAILNTAIALMRELMELSEEYRILFLQGGASQQFAMVPLNLMDKTADYAITGLWSKRAFAEATIIGAPESVFSSEERGFTRVPRPDEIKLNPGASYLHITTNNTVYGTQYHSFPNTQGVPLVADMSSDILSRKIDADKFALIYAGAQKNLGPAGVTLVIIRKDILDRSYRALPTIFKYSTHAENNSLYNTPPVFAIWVTGLVLKWIKERGGVSAIEKENAEKAALIYDVLDKSEFYTSAVEKPSRSMMNVIFKLPNEELTQKFISEAKSNGMTGLKGHRSAGGIRASIYNAFPREGAAALADFMREFERTK